MSNFLLQLFYEGLMAGGDGMCGEHMLVGKCGNAIVILSGVDANRTG